MHLHQQNGALGDQTLLFLTRLLCLVTLADYTGSGINHTQDVVMIQQCVVLLHQQTQALVHKTLLLLARLVRWDVCWLIIYTVSCNNYTQGLVTKQRHLVHLHHEVKAVDDKKTAVFNKIYAFGEVCWSYRIVYKPHARCGHETAACGASTSSNASVSSRQNTALTSKTGALGDVCWLYTIV